ncbi:hypothetical protein [Lysinibacillus sp. G4S2]|uniref:hypothetical protein n=1 Tax=Lysinibacillus sp. G4S2 TaxID=3055859 RepID=UPI0025A2A95F|nr:hypothetical protein [Lysinibacillus sp. G4S2]MDM5249916.1 hypothetical protein [Lysinibacillus sp. G4S2]
MPSISVTDETLERATRVKRLIGRPQEALLCAKMKRQQQMFSVRKRSSSKKEPSRDGNQSLVFCRRAKKELSQRKRQLFS